MDLMPKKGYVDITNLEGSLKALKSKYGEFDKFKILFLGILIGAIISALIQLLILPLSFGTDNTIRFGHSVIVQNVNPLIYFTSIFFILMLVIVGIIFIYARFVIGITPIKTVEVSYSGDRTIIYNELSKVLRERCSTLVANAKLIIPNDRRMVCRDRGEEEDLLTITFRPEVKILEITFKPQKGDSMALINEIRKLYGKSS